MNRIIILIAVVLCLNSSLCWAREFDVDLLGISYHFDKDGADHHAPNKIDHAGLWVFNPGVGLGYDFRKDIHTAGLSPIATIGFFENCANYPFFYAGAGGRYRKFIYKKFFLDLNLMAVFTEGNDWDQRAYKPAVMPFANLGLGYDFGKFLTQVQMSYVPKGIGGEITNGTDMLFLNLSVSF